MRAFLLARSKEASTWRGITLFLTALGVPLAPALSEAIITAGLGVAGLLGVLLPDGRN